MGISNIRDKEILRNKLHGYMRVDIELVFWTSAYYELSYEKPCFERKAVPAHTQMAYFGRLFNTFMYKSCVMFQGDGHFCRYLTFFLFCNGQLH